MSNTQTALANEWQTSQALLNAPAGSTISSTTAADLKQSINRQKLTAYGGAISDLETSTNAIHALYYYGQRDTDLSGAQSIALNTMTKEVNQQNQDDALAKRQNEINQWTANNKLDTLFVYQQLLIILCTTIILVYFLKRGLISTTVFFMIVGILALILVFTIVNRAQYTNEIRHTRFWNKRVFEQPPPVNVSVC
jgi:hypothetical protein